MADCFTTIISVVSYHFRSVRYYICSCLDRIRNHTRHDMYGNINDNGESFVEPGFFWSKDLDMHSGVEFSFAVIQADAEMEDYSQVEIDSKAVFVGVYDGHGGQEAAHFISKNLFQKLTRRVLDRILKDRKSGLYPENVFSGEILRAAICETEAAFLADVVENNFRATPMIGAVGSCCLIGVICNGTLYVANLGDSRAVIGSIGRCKMIVAQQLTRDHNVKNEEIIQELIICHPNDPQIVVFTRGAWRVKGTVQVSRTIGDAYLKDSKYALDASYPEFHLVEPIRRPLIMAEPYLMQRALQPNDRFIIFASDGLWEYLTNQEAVEIVHRNPRNGIAKQLIKAALKIAAKKNYMEYEELQQIEPGHRRIFHDDITVIVIFLDHGLSS